jgi:hypothetical protein
MKMIENKRGFLGGLLMVVGSGALAYSALYMVELYRESNLKENYVPLSRVELKYKDVDNDGKLETIMRVDKTNYLLMEKDNKPALFEYRLIPRNDSLVVEK